MKRLLKFGYKSLLVFIISIVMYLNLSLFYNPSFSQSNETIYNQSVNNQLNFLKSEIHNDAGSQMQDIFPEGFIFLNALYGLSWNNLITDLDKSSDIYEEGIREIKWSYNQVNSKKGKEIFNKTLPLQYGVYYTGWTNILLATLLSAQSPKDRNLKDIAKFKQNCESIAVALRNSNTPFLESYKNQSWPADMTIAIASLKIHDKIFEAQYDELIRSWILNVKQRLDSRTGLIPHQVNSITGNSSEHARGSSQSLILNFLYEIDIEFATEQFLIYKELFLDYKLGLPGIREYPKGENGNGDIDSGPVIWGIGGAASIVGQRTMFKFGELEVYTGIRNSIESFGISLTMNSKKKYIFGQLPIADAFIAWSNSIETIELKNTQNWKWRLKFQLISLFSLCFLIFIFKKI